MSLSSSKEVPATQPIEPVVPPKDGVAQPQPNVKFTPGVKEKTNEELVLEMNHEDNAAKANVAIESLNKIEQESLARSGQPGFNPYIYIANTLNPLRVILKRGTKPERYDEEASVTVLRSKVFAKALVDASKCNTHDDNLKVFVPEAKGMQVNGTETGEGFTKPV